LSKPAHARRQGKWSLNSSLTLTDTQEEMMKEDVTKEDTKEKRMRIEVTTKTMKTKTEIDIDFLGTTIGRSL
jgi:N-methylhydantoinase B/oxoprolinase/acetone carboxylase alpha subunit